MNAVQISKIYFKIISQAILKNVQELGEKSQVQRSANIFIMEVPRDELFFHFIMNIK